MPRSFWIIAGGLGVVFLSCRPSPPARSPAGARAKREERQEQPEETTSPQEQPDTVPPADVSHGEARIGGPVAEPAPAPSHSAGNNHTPVVIAPGIRYSAWTFGNRVPGPPLHVRQGDTVDFTLLNRANIPHSMDFHAAESRRASTT